MRKALTILTGIAAIAVGLAASITSKGEKTKANITAVAYEIPAPLKDRPEQIVSHTGHTTSYNKDHNTPNWSAWLLTRERANGTLPRATKFFADPKIERPYRVDYFEYKGSGYTRGHMCPAGDMKWDQKAMQDCFYMSNMCPQTDELNDGSWKQLEQACRTWAKKEGAIYIVCGPIYKGNRHEQIGINHKIDVPEAFFKVVLSLRKGQEKALGFYYENNNEKQSISKAMRTVDEIEAMTGIDFFPAVEDKLEKRIESQKIPF